jgi:hypothetical protein
MGIQSKLEVSSVPLAKLDAANLPEGFASGCLMDYYGRRLLLTVAHAAHEGPPLALAIGWDAAMRRVKLWQFGALNFIVRGQLHSGTELEGMEVKEVDFAYIEVPTEVEPRLENIDPHSGTIIESRPCSVWRETAIAEPEHGIRYGFAGHTKPSLEDHASIAADVKFCFTELRLCYPLSFIRREDDLLVFQLPVEHPGHDHFRGCSGAPIIDEEGRVVALVCRGNIEESLIYGVSLRRYQVVLDIHTGRLG